MYLLSKSTALVTFSAPESQEGLKLIFRRNIQQPHITPKPESQEGLKLLRTRPKRLPGVKLVQNLKKG